VSGEAAKGLADGLFVVGEPRILVYQEACLFQASGAVWESPEGEAKGAKASSGRALVQEPALQKGFQIRQVGQPQGIAGHLRTRRYR